MALSARPGSAGAACCDAPLRVAAPVDRVLGGELRMRHLPGSVCLRCRAVAAPPVVPDAALERAMHECAGGSAQGVVPLATRADPRGTPRGCSSCGGHAHPALLDLAVGPHAGLVAESLPGAVCEDCGSAVVPDAVTEMRRRFAAFDPRAGGAVEPSLAYDAPEHPTRLQIETTTRCNLSCAYCGHPELPHKADVRLERFRELLDRIDLARVDDVDFTGLGEPLLNPALPDMVREVARRGAPRHLRVVSNGTALAPRRFEPLCEAGITSISVSIDSLDADRFARSRGGARLSRVLANLAALVEHRQRHGLAVDIKIKAVLLDDPYAEAERLLRHSSELGLDMPHFSRLDERAAAQALYDEPWLRGDWPDAAADPFVAWCVGRWRELGGREPAPDARASARPSLGFRHPTLHPGPDVCRWAVDSCFVAGGGDALSCCEQMIDVPRLEWGSLDEHSLGELWMGPMLWGYRLPLALGLVPPRCVGCSRAPADGIPLTAEPQSGRTTQPA